MDEQAARALLEQILSDNGVQWCRESGLVRFRVRRDGMEWETNCRCGQGRVEIYGRYPFQVQNRPLAERRCAEANLRLERGAMVLPSDGRPVFRDYAEMDDPYGAVGRLRRALEYSFRAMARFWGSMEEAAVGN